MHKNSVHNNTTFITDTTRHTTNNTRLNDTYFEIEKNNIGQVKYKNSSTGVEGIKPIETERVESPEQLIISTK